MKTIHRFFLYCFYCTLAYFTKNDTVYAEDTTVYYAVSADGVKVTHISGESGFHKKCFESWSGLMKEWYAGTDPISGRGNSECNSPGDGAAKTDNCTCSYYTGTCYIGSGVVCPLTTGACSWSCENQTLCTDNTINYTSVDDTGMKCPDNYYLATETGDYTTNPNAGCQQSKDTWISYCRPCPTGQYTGSYRTRAFESIYETGRHGIETCAVFKQGNGISDQYGYFVFSNPQGLDGEIGCSYQGIPINDKEETYKESGTGTSQDY